VKTNTVLAFLRSYSQRSSDFLLPYALSLSTSSPAKKQQKKNSHNRTNIMTLSKSSIISLHAPPRLLFIQVFQQNPNNKKIRIKKYLPVLLQLLGLTDAAKHVHSCKIPPYTHTTLPSITSSTDKNVHKDQPLAFPPYLPPPPHPPAASPYSHH